MSSRKMNFRNTKRAKSDIPVSANNLVKLWLYRAMVKLGGQCQFINPFGGWENYGIASYLDVNDCVDEKNDPSMDLIVQVMGERLAYFENNHVRKAPAPTLLGNIERLGKALRLTTTARKLLCFIVMMQNMRILANGLDMLGPLSTSDLYHAVSAILGVPKASVQKELSHTSPLITSGLIAIRRHEKYDLSGKLKTLSGDFSERVTTEATVLEDLFGDVFFRAGTTSLSKEDFSHIRSQTHMLLGILQGALRQHSSGINILIHGVPGVGKTEFARLLAREAGLDLLEVASANREGDPIDGEDRLRAYRVAQSLLGPSRNLLAFDEAEDIFGRGDEIIALPTLAQAHKAWMNQILESNPTPTMWLTNAIKGIDPAFVRRFTMVLEVPSLPRGRMSELIHRVAGDILPPNSISQIAATEHLTPAIVTRAANALRLANNAIAAHDMPNAMRMLIHGTLVGQGHQGLRMPAANEAVPKYSPDFVAADADMYAICEGIRRTRRGRLCLYGPPGTGKTAFGRWLAEKIGAPLHVKRISDILSPYVGMSEKRLAKAFREAATDQAVLMLDEVDSFLQSRAGARHSWEITQVNEMLTQMESFDGVFIASTNLMDNLDPAALRRFDLKVCFGYLKPTQASGLLESYCRLLGLDSPDPLQIARLTSVSNLTPGDFAAIARRHGFSPLVAPSQFIDALIADAHFKDDRDRRSIGFVANG